MYDDLISVLRECSKLGTRYGMAVIYMEKAADAIEQLSMKLHGDEAAIAGMKREIERMVVTGASCWIPVTERLPNEELASYLCYTDAGIVVECLWTNNMYGLGPFDEWGWRIMDVPQYQRITHWMPLPEPPKEET